MATIQTDKKSTMYIKVEVGEDKTANRALTDISPALSDDKFLYYGNKIGAFQSHTVDKIVRRNEYSLIAE